MKIIFKKRFNKSYRKLRLKDQKRVDDVINLFKANPFHPLLKNHALKGLMQGKRAISVTGDIRIIFEEVGGYTYVLMVDVGSHSQVY